MIKYSSTSNGKKERIIDLKRHFFIYTLITLLLHSFTLVSQNKDIKSPVFEALIQQIDENYIPSQWNSGMERMVKEFPELYYMFLGSAMRQQENYIKKHSSNSQEFNTLNNEILSLIPQITNEYNRLNSNSIDFKHLEVSFLENMYNYALNGNIYPPLNQYYTDVTGKDLLQISIPYIFKNQPQVHTKNLSSQNTNGKSPALETLIQQIDENYVPSGWNDTMNSMDKLAGSIPQIYFTFLGIAMNKQKPYINNNPIASKNYENLNNEILFLIPDLVDLKNSEISSNDEPINDRTIGDIYIQAEWGEINETFNQNYKEQTGKDLSQISMASVLDQQIVGGTSFRKVAKKDKNEINLLGVVSSYAMAGPEVEEWQDASGGTKTEGLVCPEVNKSTHTYFFDIDTNNKPNDGTDVRCIYFGKDGPLHEQESYVNNKKHGIFLRYEMDGDIRYLGGKTNYANGEKHGIQESYTIRNGKWYLESLYTYANGKKEGVYKLWLYDSDKGTIYLAVISYYVNNKLSGIKEQYSTSSTGQRYLFIKTTYANGEMNGEEIKYSETGKVLFKNSYKNDKLHGECISYFFIRGINQTPISYCITIYDNGIKISEKCWDREGNIVQR